jgi:hypothetical protein
MALTSPIIKIDQESIREFVEVIVAPFVRKAKLHGIAAEILQAQARAEGKHGKQTHLPDGTGPDALFPQIQGRIEPVPVTAAEWALRCKYDTDKNAHAGDVTWFDILLEEVAEASEQDDLQALRAELLDSGAVIASWILAIDERIEQ